MVASFATAALALAALAAFGFALLSLLAPCAPLWWFECVAFSFLLGAGGGALVWVALMPWYGLVHPLWALTLTAGLTVTWALLRGRGPSGPAIGGGRPHWLTIVCCCVLAAQLATLLAASLRTPLGWDALFNWEIKARLAFEHQPRGQLPLAYFSDASRAWSHPRYPLTVPFAEFWMYSWLGRVDQAAVKILFPLFFGALVASMCGAVRRLTNTRIAAVAGIALGLLPPLTVGPGAVSGYADIPLAAAVTAAASCAVLALKTSRIQMFLLSGALASVAAWTKMEGLILTTCLGSAVAVASIVLSKRSSMNRVPRWASTAIVWMPVLVMAPWLLVQRHFGMPEADFPSMAPAVALTNLQRLPAILMLMTRELLKPGHWGLLWPAFAAAFALAVWKRELDVAHLILAGVVIVPFLAYSIVFLFSGWQSLTEHVSVSIPRLLTPLASPALIFTVSRAWLSST